MLHLEVDARLLQAGGIGRFIRETTSRWLNRRHVASIRFLGRPKEIEPWLAQIECADRAEILPWDARPFTASAQLTWLTKVRAQATWEPDVTLFPHFDIPVLQHPKHSVTVVHDLIQFELKDLFPGWKRFVASGLLRRTASRPRRVVTVSQASRASLLRFFAGRVSDVDVVPNGVSQVFRPLTVEEQTSKSEGSPFLLCVAEDRPHKNLSLAMQVLSSLPEREGWRLVMVGPTRTDIEAICKRTGCLHVLPRVESTGKISDDQLRKLYCEAVAVLVPSLLEGFALPAYEARACGQQVLALRRPWSEKLDRIGVRLLASTNPRLWARMLLKVRSEKSVSKMIKSEVEVPRWDDTADRLLGVLQECAKGFLEHQADD